MSGENSGGRKGALLSLTLVVEGELRIGQETVGCGVACVLPFPTLASTPAFAALCPDQPPPAEITQEDVKVMLNLLEKLCTAFPVRPSLSLSQASVFIFPWRGRSLVFFLLDYFSGSRARGPSYGRQVYAGYPGRNCL